MNKRQIKSLELVNSFMHDKIISQHIFDLGHKNTLSFYMGSDHVMNNSPDTDFHKCLDEVKILSGRVSVTTSFEVFEHLLNPLETLKAIKSRYLICTVPLNVWFSKAYWGKNKFDRHFHEFEERQFLWLLDEAGWEVERKGKWKIQHAIGIRPFLRLFFPSYLWVIAKRK